RSSSRCACSGPPGRRRSLTSSGRSGATSRASRRCCARGARTPLRRQPAELGRNERNEDRNQDRKEERKEGQGAASAGAGAGSADGGPAEETLEQAPAALEQ